MKYTSKYLEEAVEAFASLPSIGKKSALRLVLYLLQQDEYKSKRLSQAIDHLKSEVKTCKKCHAWSDYDVCDICASTSRNNHQICVVESIRDMLAIEETQQYNGKYHVLGGLISPLDGIGPDDLHIDSLLTRIDKGDVNELIMAIAPSIEGETTIYYISRHLEGRAINISVIARGVSFAGDLEYADEITLGRSILSRVPYANSANGSI
jgi:recombination protein RecR